MYKNCHASADESDLMDPIIYTDIIDHYGTPIAVRKTKKTMIRGDSNEQ